MENCLSGWISPLARALSLRQRALLWSLCKNPLSTAPGLVATPLRSMCTSDGNMQGLPDSQEAVKRSLAMASSSIRQAILATGEVGAVQTLQQSAFRMVQGPKPLQYENKPNPYGCTNCQLLSAHPNKGRSWWRQLAINEIGLFSGCKVLSSGTILKS